MTSSPPNSSEAAQLTQGIQDLQVSREKGSSSDELARFRQEWEAEVKKSRGATKSAGEASSHFRPISKNEAARRATALQGQGDGTAVVTSTQPGDPLRLMQKAIQLYAQAVESERTGQLDEALVLYRKAFRLDPNVDRLFERASNAIQVEIEQGEEGALGRRDVLIETEEVRNSLYKALNVEDYRYRAMKKRQEQTVDSTTTKAVTTKVEPKKSEDKGEEGQDELSALINRLSIHSGGERNFDQVRLEADDEDKPLPIAKLPEEVLLHILSFIAAPRDRRGARIGIRDEPAEATEGEVAVKEDSHRKVIGIGVVLAGPDYMSIEQLGRTCWKFRMLTRAWSVWRYVLPLDW